jgi:hypothetical protein
MCGAQIGRRWGGRSRDGERDSCRASNHHQDSTVTNPVTDPPLQIVLPCKSAVWHRSSKTGGCRFESCLPCWLYWALSRMASAIAADSLIYQLDRLTPLETA